MAVTNDILRSWRSPRQVMRALLDQGQREDRAIAYLLVACLMIFVAQWPRLARTAHLEGTEFARLAAYEFLSWLMIWPLLLYGVAALSYGALRLSGARLTPYGARLALFWAILASVPLGLFYGLLTGLNGPGAGANLVGALWLGLLGLIWVQNLREASARESGR